MPRHLVQRHLENVSGELLADYGDLLAQHARGKCGIYVLYKDEKMYYVGLATNLNSRLKTHVNDRHKGKWDRFSIYLTRNDAHMRELEALLHRVLRPEGNRQIGRLKGSTDLRRQLRAELRAKHKERLAEIMGERVRVRQTSNDRSIPNGRIAVGERPLAGWTQRACTLRAWYKGEQHDARLLRNGMIRFGGDSFDSPSAAAVAITGRPTNGWWLWHMQDVDGEWVRLRDLRE